MSGQVAYLPRTALTAPFAVVRPFEQLGRALGLYLHLLGIANQRGLVIRNAERLTRPLAVTEADLACWLERLGREGLVEVKSPLPFLVARLTAWSGSDSSENDTPRVPGSRSAPLGETPGYSNSSSVNLQNQAVAMAGEDGGAGEGEGEDALLREILDTLGETDANAFRRVVEVYPSQAIRRALARVRRVPSGRVRKSKTALFRYLLTKRN